MPFRHCTAGLVEAVVKVRVVVSVVCAKSKEGCLASFSAVAIYLLSQFAKDNRIATVAAYI